MLARQPIHQKEAQIADYLRQSAAPDYHLRQQQMRVSMEQQRAAYNASAGFSAGPAGAGMVSSSVELELRELQV